MKTRSMVILSGGQDSVTCLYRAHADTEVVKCIYFDYGSQHMAAELECAKYHCDRLDVPLQIIDLSLLQQITDGATNLTVAGGDTTQESNYDSSLPSSFVPGRNLFFWLISGVIASIQGVAELYTGICETDYSGYPDCRLETVYAFVDAFFLGTGKELTILTPLMYIDKAGTFKLAFDLGVLWEITEHTHTGYHGDTAHRYAWGYGPALGEPLDPASTIRANGWAKFCEQYPNELTRYYAECKARGLVSERV